MLSSLTYDDVRLARTGAGLGAKVALDLVGGLIEQIQVVFHRVSIVKALAQTDNTWCRGRRQLYPCGVLIYWKEPLWRLQIFVGNISSFWPRPSVHDPNPATYKYICTGQILLMDCWRQNNLSLLFTHYLRPWIRNKRGQNTKMPLFNHFFVGKLNWTRMGIARGPKEEIKGARKVKLISSLKKKTLQPWIRFPWQVFRQNSM